jgi:pyruvate dehydrogenase E1 component beta subunit
VVRVGAPFMPVPFSSELEQRYAVNAESVIRGLRKVLA